ncbi:NYN domain-containing protein [Arthrobacter sp. MSA 4-2]|uniref:NYN domain-containing protein n=1 Tax=Arthrobacter sp. MSA 4-2 TaxID=2794349 RepID=UPI0022B84453|nr:NYN domain-containing protein [Arthrobacter sp. MSA 4-2]
MEPGGTPPRRNVAVFLDMENLYGGVAGHPTSVPVGSILKDIGQLVRDSGVGALTAVARAYANWGRAEMGTYRRQLLGHGVEPVQIFSFSQDIKNAADIELVVDALRVAAEAPWIEVFVIVSGDGGYVPLVRRLHALGKYVIVVTTSGPDVGAVSSMLRSAADQFHVVAVPEPPAPPPTLAEYREAILSLVGADPELLIDGRVNGARLGMLLRKRWPGTTSKSFQYRSLGALVEENCGLRMIRHVEPKPVPEMVPA